MKKIILSALILAQTAFAFGQETMSVNQVLSDHSVFDGVKSSSGKALKYEEISGTPYTTKNFSNAKLADNYEQLPIRYNSYTDEIEFQKNGEISVLAKENKFSQIEITLPKQTIAFLDTSDELSGYFFEVVRGKNTLYKKIKTKFIDAVPAANSYASDRPAAFKTLDPIFYIKTEEGFIKKPRNQKEIIEYFPDKKENTTKFFKSNKIKFNKEEDLIKLVTFLNQN
ncbi:hypothetical protein [Chryseobacterium carnipullorum]|uniref:hypothetical protein n=1 Tax=Chryseobacterium carnipullorum TaxID=1124835 RepID=UPI000E7EB27A|nr:hypothetical protein [Chryseobacterium carnipullorum]HBV16886.1 hypothetical protein [Chryseobacterium carnipullorum]